MGKYQLDDKGQAAVSKYHEKQQPNKINKQEKLAKLRADYLKNKQNKETK
ncbi:MAG: hypothetical protein ACTJHC_04760 [Vagococcus sp.]